MREAGWRRGVRWLGRAYGEASEEGGVGQKPRGNPRERQGDQEAGGDWRAGERREEGGEAGCWERREEGAGAGGSVPGCPGARGTGTPRGEGRKAVSPSGTGSYKEGREELGERGRGIGKGRPESSQGWGVRLV